MYVFSTDPGVGFRRLNFENGQATVPLPKGKLVLRRRDINVDMSGNNFKRGNQGQQTRPAIGVLVA
jgi:hypothetical protein